MIRPKLYDDEVISLAVTKLLPEVMRWMNNESPEDEVRADLESEMDFVSDGYEFARNLERNKHWVCDSALVEVLDGLYNYDALDELERRWIATYRVFPCFQVGAHITYKNHPAEIVRIDGVRGKYSIFCEALGHVRKGTGTHAAVVDWEKIDGKVNALGLTIVGPLFSQEPVQI